MVEFALLATVLVAIVIAVVWKLRPRESQGYADGVGVNPPPETAPVATRPESSPSLLEMAKRERNGDFRASLAGLVSPERWRGSGSPSLDELRRIVETWAESNAEPKESTAGASGWSADTPRRVELGSDPSEDLVSSVAGAVGVPLVEVRIRSRSEVTVLMRRDRHGTATTAVVR